MSDLEKVVLGAFGAVGVYVVGQIVVKFLVEPLHELRLEVGKIRFSLSYHQQTIHTPISRSSECSTSARDALYAHSSPLLSLLHVVPGYEVTRWLAFGVLPARDRIEKAAIQLRALSTYVHETGAKANDSVEEIRQRVDRIEKLLNLRPLQ